MPKALQQAQQGVERRTGTTTGITTHLEGFEKIVPEGPLTRSKCLELPRLNHGCELTVWSKINNVGGVECQRSRERAEEQPGQERGARLLRHRGACCLREITL